MFEITAPSASTHRTPRVRGERSRDSSDESTVVTTHLSHDYNAALTGAGAREREGDLGGSIARNCRGNWQLTAPANTTVRIPSRPDGTLSRPDALRLRRRTPVPRLAAARRRNAPRYAARLSP